MANTPNLSLPYVVAGTAAEQNHNSGLNVIDVLLRGRAISRVESTPPTNAEGDCYIIDPAGTPAGGWAAFAAGDVVFYTGGQWTAITPVEGMRLRIDDESGTCVFYTATGWRTATGESIFAAARITTDQTLGTGGTWTAIQWNQHVKYIAAPGDVVFGHSTSTNPDQITLKEAGDYEVTVDVTIVASSTGGANVGHVRLTVGGSAVAQSVSVCSVDSATLTQQTVTISAIVTATAGQILTVEGTRSSGSGTLSVAYDKTRIRVRRV